MEIEALLDEFDRGTAILCSNTDERQTVLQCLSEQNRQYIFPEIVEKIRIYGRSRTSDCLDYLYVMKAGTQGKNVVVSLYSRIGNHDFIPYSVFAEIINGANEELCEPNETEFNDSINGLLFG